MRPTTTARLPHGGWLAIAAGSAAVSLVLAACSAGGSATPSAQTSVAASPSAGASAAASVPASVPASEAAGGYVLTVVQTSAGAALAGEDGKTLYTKSDDTSTASTCNGGCATAWPPFTLDSGEAATAGDGVTGTIGSITRDDGSTQVTYNGHPVYYYSGDSASGDATGQGIGGIWYIASPTA